MKVVINLKQVKESPEIAGHGPPMRGANFPAAKHQANILTVIVYISNDCVHHVVRNFMGVNTIGIGGSVPTIVGSMGASMY